MRFQGALLREQGVEFGIVIVKEHILANRFTAERMLGEVSGIFGPAPVVLMAQDRRGAPRYFGRSDLTRFLAHVPLQTIPWREYTCN